MTTVQDATGFLSASDSVAQVIENASAKVVEGLAFPLTLGPKDGKAVSADSLARWVERNRDAFANLAMVHGAVLFRGFGTPEPTDFGKVIKALHLENMPYVGGAAVRRNVVGDFVFTANESPPSEPIPFHHEMAQVPNPPKYVMFHCEIAPEQGGETPLILSHEVYKYFAKTYPEVCAKVEELGVRYVRTMPEEDDATSAIGRSWKNTFLVSNKEEAEAKMREIGTEWEWLPNGDLRTVTAIVPAIRADPRQQKKMFFNSMVAAFTGWVDSRNDPTKAVLYGDGTVIDAAAMLGVSEFMKDARSVVPWFAGDICIVDNTVALHSRNVFEGKRRVLASVGRLPLPFTVPADNTLENVSEYTYDDVEERTVIAAKLKDCYRVAMGDYMPKVGFGVWKISKEDTAASVENAIRAGYRHLDCACDYGNEVEVGQGIRNAISAGVVTRQELWITSKLWNTYHAAEHVKMACKKSLSDLGLEYLDLYLIHFPIAQKFVPFETRYPPEWFFDPNAKHPRMEFAKVPTHVTWRAMEDLVTCGLVRNIGVCNFSVQLLTDLLNYAKVLPAVVQVELHPYNTQQGLVKICQERGIVVTGFSPLGHASYLELNMSKENESVMSEEVIKKAAQAHGKTAAQVILRWGIQRNTAIIPKTSKVERMKENIDIFDFELTADEMSAIDDLNRNRRFNDPAQFALEAFNTHCPIYQ